MLNRQVVNLTKLWYTLNRKKQDMIKNEKLLAELEKEELRKEKLSYTESLRLFEAMWSEGISLGVLPLRDPLEGIDHCIRIGRILNSCSVNL